MAQPPRPASVPLRAVLQQPAVPAYRVPVFSELSRRLGHPVRVLSYGNTSVPNVDGVADFEIQRARLRASPGLRGHRLFWDEGQWLAAGSEAADVVLLAWDIHYLSLVPALLRARARGLGTVLWGHGYSLHEKPLVRPMRDGVTFLSDAVVFYDGTTADAFAARTRHRGVFVAANSLDQRPIAAAAAEWKQRPEHARAHRAAHGVSAPYLLFVSRLQAENKVEVLLRAAKKLAKAGRPIDVVIIGTGPDEARLKAHSMELGLEARVHFLGALYEESALAPWFQGALAFCYPANIGLSLHHAFGYGLPVLVGDDRSAHNPEIQALRHGENGLAFAHGDADELAAACVLLMDRTDLRAQLGREALRTATQIFTLDRMVDGLEAAIRHAHSVRRY